MGNACRASNLYQLHQNLPCNIQRWHRLRRNISLVTSSSNPMQLESINSIHSYFAYTVESRIKRDGLTTTIGSIKLVIIGNRHNGIGVVP
jgi:hypothetical protein